MNSLIHADKKRTSQNKGIRGIFDAEVNIKVRALSMIAFAGVMGNAIGILAKRLKADTLETDTITKAQTQTGFIKKAEKILRGDSSSYILLYFNIFSFKAINSIFGIEGGNRLLQLVAGTLSEASFSPCLVGRLNADRFVCLVKKNTFDESALNNICQLPFEENGHKVMVILNCGVYEITDRTIPVSSMIDRANAALKYIHDQGYKYYAVYDDEVEKAYNDETVVLGEINQALNDGAFIPYYQPIVDCKTKEIISAEALARWIHPVLGVVSPQLFIPILEKKNLITQLDKLITDKTDTFINERVKNGQKIVPISINLSRYDFYDDDMTRDILSIAKNSAINRFGSHFEVTESAYENIPAHTLNLLAEIRKSGGEILIDDFGTGYSSLGMITSCEFDIIKLDAKFSSEIIKNEKTRIVVQSLIEMAHNLGSKIIAEGVETEAQYIAFKECGCDYIQGYYFYKPMPAEEFASLLNG